MPHTRCDRALKAERKECGCPPFIEQATKDYRGGLKTCPVYLNSTAWVSSILNDVDDYERGALGNVDLIGEARLSYLRWASHFYKQRNEAWLEDASKKDS